MSSRPAHLTAGALSLGILLLSLVNTGGHRLAASETTSNALGLLPLERVSFEATIPGDSLWRSRHGSFVESSTVKVEGEDGDSFERVGGTPKADEFRARLDGCLRFCKDDSGRRVRITYEYRPRHVAVLPAYAGSDYADAVPTLTESLTAQLRARGFVLASADDLADALVELGHAASQATSGWDRDTVRELACRLDVAYLILPGVDASSDRVFAGFSSHGHVTGSGHVRQTTTAVHKNYMEVAVGMVVLHGVSGYEMVSQVREGSKRVRFRRFGPARRSLIRELTAQVVADWRGPLA